MPAESERQRRFMGADLGRKEKGEETETGMSKEQLRGFARKKGRHSTRGKRKLRRSSRE